MQITYTPDQLEAAMHIAENGLWLGEKGTQWNVMAERLPHNYVGGRRGVLESVAQILAAEVKRLNGAIRYQVQP